MFGREPGQVEVPVQALLRTRIPTARRPMKDAAAEKKRLDAVTVKAIKSAASDTHPRNDKRGKPEIQLPIRSLQNVRYDVKKGYFEIGKGKSIRTLTFNTVKTFAQSLKMMALSKQLVV